MTKLSVKDHSRIFNNFTYVYPVASRRAEGLSVGINLNINNACNWRCKYCQVPNLTLGNPPIINLEILEQELEFILNEILFNNFIKKYLPKNLQRFNDICISGNGEATLSKNFKEVVQIIARLRKKYQLDSIKTILITNGSQIHNKHIAEGIQIISHNNGEIWFKIDRGNSNDIKNVNQVNISISKVIKNLFLCSKLCKTYIQTCWFKTDNKDPTDLEINSYINIIESIKLRIEGVLLYSTARTPQLMEGKTISNVDESFLINLKNKLTNFNIKVKYYL